MKKSLLFSIVLAAIITGCKTAPEIKPFEFIMGTGIYTASNMAMPDKGEEYQDPNFLTMCRRITKKADYPDPGIENEYARCDPENCNGTTVILRGNEAHWFLYNRSDCAVIREVTAFNQCNQEPEPRWDASDPNIFYYFCETQLRSYNTSTGASTAIHDFSVEFPGAMTITTRSEGDASLDRRYWCFMVLDSAWSLVSLITYDRTNDSIIGQRNSSFFPEEFDWCSVGMSGGHCIVGFSSLNYVRVFPLDLSSSIDLPAGSNAHGDLALTTSGEDVFVYQNTATDYISMADLNTGTETQLIPIPFDVNTDIGLHFSGNCSETPGWVLVSTYGSFNPPSGESHSWMDCQLYMLELKANPRIWRIAHTQAYTSEDYNGEKNYFAEAFAAINSSGTRIYWGSNWRNYTMDYTDTYVVTLEDNWVTEMPTE